MNNKSTHYPASAGKRFRQAVTEEKPLMIVGTINAYCALMAEKVGHKSIYLSGAGVANASYGLPDLGITSPNDVLDDVRRITAVTELPLLVDIDTGWGGVFNIARTVHSMIKAGAAAVHIEDQVMQKRCGHRPNKAIVTQGEMVDRIKAAVDAKTDPDFVIMARTDALAVEGLQSAIDRSCAYVEAGADMIFPEAITQLSMYKEFADAVAVPILANITEFGSTPLFSADELAGVNVSMMLFPLSGFRAMNSASLNVYKVIRAEGTQKNVVDTMHSRAELYDYLDYHEFEEKLNDIFSNSDK